MDAVQSLGAPLNDYSTVVATVCQENSNVSERNRLNASAECLVGFSFRCFCLSDFYSCAFFMQLAVFL